MTVSHEHAFASLGFGSGVQLIEDRRCPAPREWAQVRHPRRKCWRIVKRWRKNRKNWGWRSVAPTFYRVDGSAFSFGFMLPRRDVVVAHPDCILILRRALMDTSTHHFTRGVQP